MTGAADAPPRSGVDVHHASPDTDGPVDGRIHDGTGTTDPTGTSAPLGGEFIRGDRFELLMFGTSSGRLAHVRRTLLAQPGVTDARIASYGGRTAFFTVQVAPGTTTEALVPRGTRLITSDGWRVEVRVE